jgi:hypothetical protein
MDVLTLYINNADRNLHLVPGTLEYESTVQEQGTLTCSLISTDGSYRPVIGHTVQLVKDRRTMTIQTVNGSVNFTVTAGGPLNTTDVGRVLSIPNGGGPGITLIARIMTRSSSTAGTLEFPAGAAVSSSSILAKWLWGGFITRLGESPFSADSGHRFTVTCQDYNSYINRILINTYFLPSVTTKDALTVIQQTLNFAFGTRLDPAMPAGSAIGSLLSYSWRPGMEPTDRLVQKEEWIWTITPDNVFRAYPPSTVTLPTMTSATPLEGTIEIERNFDDYRNDQRVFFGGTGQGYFADYIYGDGVTRYFPLFAFPVVDPVEDIGQVVVTTNPGAVDATKVLGALGSGAPYEYDPANNRIVQNVSETLLDSNDFLLVEYVTQFPLVVGAGNPTGVSTYGFFSRSDDYPQTSVKEVAQAYADELITRYGQAPQTMLTMETYDETYAVVGARVPVNLPNRGLSTVNFVVLSVSGVDDDSYTLKYVIEMALGNSYRERFIDFWREMTPDNEAAAVSSSGAAAPSSPGGVIPATPGTGGSTGGGGTTAGPVRILLGGNNSEPVNTTGWRPVPNAVPVLLKAADFPNALRFRTYFSSSNGALTCQFRMKNYTDGTTILGTASASSGAVAAPNVSEVVHNLPVVTVDGVYQLEMNMSAATASGFVGMSSLENQ